MFLRPPATISTARRFFHTALLESSSLKNAPVDIHPEVQDALNNNRPLVALETTLVTHGLPYPDNLNIALSMERIVRSTGSVPATIGILAGRVKIGLETNQLEHLAESALADNKSAYKVSRRDIGAVIAFKSDGGTTCSGTMALASLLGIKVFATGGLGGVHKGGENSMDISADLQELARSPIGVVSAGIKSILDIRRTLEYLETMGVPVVSYSKTKEFPAFFTPKSGINVPWNVEEPSVAARILYSQLQLGTTGTLFAVPIPEQYAPNGDLIQSAVDQAIRESEENGISKQGNLSTPWILGRVRELTNNLSLINNVALLENTALVGGQIAVEYNNLVRETEESKTYVPIIYKTLPKNITLDIVEDNAQVIIVGSAALDITSSSFVLAPGTTSPGQVGLTLGGVSRNLAEVCHRVLNSKGSSSSATLLVSSIGNDSFGHIVQDKTRKLGMRTDGLTKTENHRTAVCNMVLDSLGSLIGGVADMDITQHMSSESVIECIKKHPKTALVALDGNLSPNTISDILQHCNSANIPIFFEPTSVPKSLAILPALTRAAFDKTAEQSPVAFVSPNLAELENIYSAAMGEYDLTSRAEWWSVIDRFSLGVEFRQDILKLSKLAVASGHKDGDKKGTKTLSFLVEAGVVQQAVNLLPLFQVILISLGDMGNLVVFHISNGSSAWRSAHTNIQARRIVAQGKETTVVVQHFPPIPLANNNHLNVTGAGDSLVGTLIAELSMNPDLFLHPHLVEAAMSHAQRNAVLTLKSSLAVSEVIGT